MVALTNHEFGEFDQIFQIKIMLVDHEIGVRNKIATIYHVWRSKVDVRFVWKVVVIGATFHYRYFKV